MTLMMKDLILIQSGKAAACPMCRAVYSLDHFQVNGVGRRMGLCQTCYGQLFAMGPHCLTSRAQVEKMEQIKAAAHEGLKRLKQRPVESTRRERYGYSVKRR
jgi:hypothetical protein